RSRPLEIRGRRAHARKRRTGVLRRKGTAVAASGRPALAGRRYRPNSGRDCHDGRAGQQRMKLRLRAAVPSHAAAIAVVHVRSWQVGYRGILPDPLLDALADHVEATQLLGVDVDQLTRPLALVADAR